MVQGAKSLGKPRGIINLQRSYTCYAISAFQLMYNYPGFVEDFLQIKLPETDNAAKVVQKLMRSLTVGVLPLNSVELRRLCGEMGFPLGVHHDSVEFFHKIVQTLSQEVPGFSFISMYLKKSTLYTGLPDYVDSGERMCYYLTVPNEKNTDIQSEIERAIEAEFRQDPQNYPVADNQYYFAREPKAVLIAVNRVSNDGSEMFKTENQIVINRTIQIKLSTTRSSQYTFGGAILHRGKDYKTGHYYVCLKRLSDKFWYILDDKDVLQSNLTTVRELLDKDSPQLLIYIPA